MSALGVKSFLRIHITLRFSGSASSDFGGIEPCSFPYTYSLIDVILVQMRQ
jgi:hypothetical protein